LISPLVPGVLPNKEPLLMTIDPDEIKLKDKELDLRMQELAFERAKLSIEFAKYGFAGTLTAAIGGILLIFCLAVLSAFTSFKVDTWTIVMIAFSVLVGSVAFGYLSLWELPKIATRIQKEQIEIAFGSERK
jgi:hypothetical protein